MDEATASLGAVFAGELYRRLRWFLRLRWLAVAGLVLASLGGRELGFSGAWPSLALLGVAIALANLFFRQRMVARLSADSPPEALRACALYQMLVDLAALMVAVHYTGGLESPLLPFFVFHMAIGTILVATDLMYLMAFGTCWGTVCLYILEVKGVLPYHPVDPARPLSGRASGLNLGALAVTLFGIIYLTDSVMRRFWRRNLELAEAKGRLEEQTAELQVLLGQMRELERRKSHFMRISAHQLRSPLGTVRTSLEVLGQGFVDPTSERGRRLMEGAVERVDGLLDIVNDLLELAKVREGRGRAPWARNVFLNQLLTDLVDALSTKAEQHEVRLEADLAEPAVLDWGVPPDLVFAFENLVENAIKYSYPGGLVSVRLSVDNGSAVVEVSDQGIGIPADLGDEVFFEFVRAPGAKKHAPEGTGLGLAIVREVAEGHGGSVTVVSREHQGSTFTMRLPLQRTDPGRVMSLQSGNGGGNVGGGSVPSELP